MNLDPLDASKLAHVTQGSVPNFGVRPQLPPSLSAPFHVDHEVANPGLPQGKHAVNFMLEDN
jgi:hypothetical protein